MTEEEFIEKKEFHERHLGILFEVTAACVFQTYKEEKFSNDGPMLVQAFDKFSGGKAGEKFIKDLTEALVGHEKARLTRLEPDRYKDSEPLVD